MLIKLDVSAPSADRNNLPVDSNIAHEQANQDTFENSDKDIEEDDKASLDSEEDPEENPEDEFDDFEYSEEDMGPPEREVEEKEHYFGESGEFKLSFKIYL